VLAAVGALAVAAGLLVAPAITAAANPPPNPSDSQLSAAARQKNALADQVGRLSAQVAEMRTQLEQLKAQQELAEQKYVYALSQLQAAQAAAVTAKQKVAAAQAAVVQAQQDFVGYVRASYMSGDVSGTTGTLLTANDPNVLLEQGTLQDYQSSHQLNAIGTLQRATIAKSNADAEARLAVQKQQAATTAANRAKDEAVAAYKSAKQQEKQMQATLAANERSLTAAQAKLASLNNQRAQYNAYVKEQARLAELARQRALAQQRAAAAAAAAAAARANSGGGGGGGGGGGSYVAPGPVGHWTAAAGRTAVARAERWLGTPYSWAGGNASGPTYGVCAGDGAFNDCNVVGFDCSGLVMYAWAQYPFAHYAATQYQQGSVHPNMASLKPGDLVFWSSNGMVSGIHHVAMYIGGGNVIQAPESGDVVKITPLYAVSWGLFGATRPLT
jgi:cell wall-associated NlpC family hydrolase